MESEESKQKLLQEIAQLSHLIATSQPRRTHNPTPAVYSSRNLSNLTTTSARQWFSSSIPSTNLVYRSPFATLQNGRRLPLIQPSHYPNPFRKSAMNGYSRQVFPDRPIHYAAAGETTNTIGKMLTPFKLERKNSDNLAVTIINSDESLGQRFVCLGSESESTSTVAPPTHTTANTPTEIPVPRSVYINPSHISAREDGTAAIRIRPHLNPAFQTNYCAPTVSETDKHDLITTVSTSFVNPSISDKAFTTTATFPQPSFQLPVSATSIHTSTPMKSTYKLDRRTKRSPIARKGSCVSPRMKSFKRFSMRLVSRHLTSTLTRFHYRQPSKSLRLPQKNYTQKFINSRVPEKGPKSKSVVSIGGSKYLRKNNGKSLKRMSLKPSPASVVYIKGRQFIKRNGGRSLSHVVETRRVRLKSSSQSFSLSQPSTGVILANRAIAKSKMALSQRTWRKKRFCVFYNRFGECKKNESGKCPYIHDKNQLTICPKFVVGKCTNPECKLSHDLKVGRMMPCQFFNKSECSRENCPYPHVKSGVVKKSKASPKVTTHKVDLASKDPPTSDSGNKGQSKKNQKCKTTKNTSDVDDDGKSRYFQEKLNSQPMISIVPRRLPLNTMAESDSSTESVSSCSKSNKLPNNSREVLTKGSQNDKVQGSHPTQQNELENVNCNSGGSVRMRLMSKVTSLRDKMKKKESTAPTFLSFK